MSRACRAPRCGSVQSATSRHPKPNRHEPAEEAGTGSRCKTQATARRCAARPSVPFATEPWRQRWHERRSTPEHECSTCASAIAARNGTSPPNDHPTSAASAAPSASRTAPRRLRCALGPATGTLLGRAPDASQADADRPSPRAHSPGFAAAPDDDRQCVGSDAVTPASREKR
jgi:hypothetical protein